MSETLINFGHQTLKTSGCNPFNTITLNIFDVSNIFYASIRVV